MGNKKNNSLLLYNSSKDDLSSELYSFEKIKGFCHEKNDTKAYGRFNGKTVIITGAKGDFGQVCSKRMAEEGAVSAESVFQTCRFLYYLLTSSLFQVY